MKNSSIWRIATALFAVGSIIYTSTSSQRSRRTGREQMKQAESEPEFDVPVEYQRVFDQNLIIPAGWSFGVVWSTVYSGLGALLVHQALQTQENNPRYQKALPWWWASWTLNTIFGRFFSQNDARSIVISDLTTKLNLPAALGLHHSLEIGKTDVPGPEKYLRIPVSLYAGWLTAATVVGTPDTLLTLNAWDSDDERDVPLAAGILGATAGAGYVIARHLNDPLVHGCPSWRVSAVSPRASGTAIPLWAGRPRGWLRPTPGCWPTGSRKANSGLTTASSST